MKVRGKGCTIVGTEGSSPPLPYIEVADSEGAALIGLGHAEEVTGEDAKAPKKAAKSEPTPAPTPAPPPASTTPTKMDEDRAVLIADALDLVEGEPTVEAVADITGLTDVTVEEIAAAIAAKDAAANA